jgi:hypothetical protein
MPGETEALWTFTIVTTSANKEFSWLHDRQPVILSTPEALNRWLDTSSRKWSDDLVPLVAPTTCALEWYEFHTSPGHPYNLLYSYQVPKEVGKVGTESSTFIEPVANRKDGIQAMFTKQKEAQTTPKKAVKKRAVSPADNSKIEVLDEATPRKTAKKRTISPADDSDILDGPSPSKKVGASYRSDSRTHRRARPNPRQRYAGTFSFVSIF